MTYTDSKTLADLISVMSRRRFLSSAAALAAGTAILGGCSGQSDDEPDVGGPVNYLGWQGYEDASILGDFFEASGVEINASYIAGNDDIITKLTAGGVGSFDVATPFIAYVAPLVALDLLQPIPTDRLSNFEHLYPIFQDLNLPGMEAPAGSTYSVPLIWGAFTMLYLPDQVPSPPTYWTDLLDPAFEGRVIMYDDAYSQILVWAKAIGVLATGAQLTQGQLDQVRDSLIELKRNSLTIVPNYAEMTDIMARGEGWIATSGWDAVISFAAEKETVVASHVPSEGTFSWTDTYAFVKDAPNRDSALALIDAVISTPVQTAFAPFLVSGLTNKTAADALGDDLRSLYPYDDIDQYFVNAPLASVPPLEEAGSVATLQDWQRAWAEVKEA